ncbi:MAG: hypothetical protein ACRDU9_05410 [Acidimicrobiia bacterium]
MYANETFDSLYRQLAEAWDSHQTLRRSETTIADLMESSLRLQQARLAMFDWKRCNQLENC